MCAFEFVLVNLNLNRSNGLLGVIRAVDWGHAWVTSVTYVSPYRDVTDRLCWDSTVLVPNVCRALDRPAHNIREGRPDTKRCLWRLESASLTSIPWFACSARWWAAWWCPSLPRCDMARDSEPPLAARRAIRVADGMGQFVICRAGGREGGREGGRMQPFEQIVNAPQWRPSECLDVRCVT